MPPRDTQGWSLPRTSRGAPSASMSPGLASIFSPLKTAPAMIKACARVRLSARPRLTSNWSARIFAILDDQRRQTWHENGQADDGGRDCSGENSPCGHILGITDVLIRLDCYSVRQPLD